MLTHFALHDCSEPSLDGNDRAATFWAATRSQGTRLTIVTLVPFRRRQDLGRRLAYYGLSPREMDGAENSIRSSLSQAQLAQRLCISEETVRSHLRESYRKIGVGKRIELLAMVLGLDCALITGLSVPAALRKGRCLRESANREVVCKL